MTADLLRLQVEVALEEIEKVAEHANADQRLHALEEIGAHVMRQIENAAPEASMVRAMHRSQS